MMRRTSLLCQDIYLIPLDNYRDLRAKQSRITSVLKRDPATKIDLARPLAEECGLWNGELFGPRRSIAPWYSVAGAVGALSVAGVS
jgi:hypothetical protein